MKKATFYFIVLICLGFQCSQSVCYAQVDSNTLHKTTKREAEKRLLKLKYKIFLKELGLDKGMIQNETYQDVLLEKEFLLDEILRFIDPAEEQTQASVGAWRLIEYKGVQDDRIYDIAMKNLREDRMMHYTLPYLRRSKSKVFVHEVKQRLLRPDTGSGGSLLDAVTAILSPDEAVDWMDELEKHYYDKGYTRKIESFKKHSALVKGLIDEYKSQQDPEFWLMKKSIVDFDKNVNRKEMDWIHAVILNHHDNEFFWRRYTIFLTAEGALEKGSRNWWLTYKMRSHFRANVVGQKLKNSSGTSMKKENTRTAEKGREVTNSNVTPSNSNSQAQNHQLRWVYVILVLLLVGYGFWHMKQKSR